MTDIAQCYYFGCHYRAGHHLWTEKGRSDRTVYLALPFRYTILDGGLLPANSEQTEGEASLSHIAGWTVISFWDRSIDKRGGSNSSFVIPAKLDFSTAIEVSKERFPWVWSRFNFEVVQRR